MTVNIDEMSVIELIELKLGLKPKQEFTVKPTERAKILGCKESDMIYSFRSDQLMHKGYNDGWSEWYGWNDLPAYQKRGSCCVRNKIVISTDGAKETTQLRDISKSENEWIIDKNIPIFRGEDREYIDRLVYVGEE